jgi:hypothetical protein
VRDKTILDLILPRVFAGERVDRSMLVALGHGGLLNQGQAFRFPPYGERQRRAPGQPGEAGEGLSGAREQGREAPGGGD